MIRLYNWHGHVEEFESLPAAQSWVMADYVHFQRKPKWEETPTLDPNIKRVRVADQRYVMVQR